MENNNKEPQSIIFIVGDLVNLRLLKESDLYTLLSLVNNPKIREISLKRKPITEATEKKWLEKNIIGRDDEIHLGIIVPDKDDIIGIICLYDINQIHGTAYLGIIINPSFQGKGYGPKSVNMIINYAFTHLNLRKINWSTYASNKHSIICAQKCGFIEEAKIKDQYQVGNNLIDEVILSIFRKDFLINNNLKEIVL